MNKEYILLEEKIKELGLDIEWIKDSIKQLNVELPSWGFGDSGTRFKVFRQKGVPSSLYEKLDDAAIVNKYTGVCKYK